MKTNDPLWQRFADYSPTRFDQRGLCSEGHEDWRVVYGTNRDADALQRSNWAVICKELQEQDPEGVDHDVHRFGHWACGWLEVLLVRPDTPAATVASEILIRLADYPVANETHFSDTEQEEANEVWANCYDVADRIAYIRAHRSQFEFHDMADMVACVRGRYFAGYASELIS